VVKSFTGQSSKKEISLKTHSIVKLVDDMKQEYIQLLSQYRKIYQENLTDSVIPFWLKNSPDRINGGTFSCLDRYGRVYDTKKYVWLVGRSAWMFSRLYNEFDKNESYPEMALLGIDFLRKNARDSRGRYYFSLTSEGNPWFYQRKPYGAVFAMLAYLEYFKLTGKNSFKLEAERLFWKITHWIEDPVTLGRPIMAGVPRMSNLAGVMVVASMAVELARVDKDPRYIEIIRKALEGCRLHYDPLLNIFLENVPVDNGINIRHWPEGRLFNPGHSIEVAWFILHMVRLVPDNVMLKMALDVLEGSLNFGWDKEHGGLYYFMDIEEKPTLQLESTMKLWWPHTEALYALVLAYSITRDKKWLDWLERVHQYSFAHFVDGEHGEWYGYCDRMGRPTSTCKGGNYKGFFHVPRALLFCVQEINQLLNQNRKD
jgi:N-acylglucosamine 2-epimerase